MITVTLSPDELYQAVAVGGHRRITSIFGRRQEEHYQSEDNSEWSTEIESCGAEISVAKIINKYWNGGSWDGKVSKSDVDGMQVRNTHHYPGHMLVYGKDSDNDKIIHVSGRSPKFNIMGWKIAGDCKRDEFWRKNCNRPCWWVPVNFLIPINNVNDLILNSNANNPIINSKNVLEEIDFGLM